MQQLLEVGQARVRAGEDRCLLEWRVERADDGDDRGAFVFDSRERAQDRLGPVGQRRAQLLLGAAE